MRLGSFAVGIALVMLAGWRSAHADCALTKPGRTQYSVKIDSTPAGAAVYINDKSCQVGVTPWDGKLNNADYTVIVEAPGFEPATQTFKVARQPTLQVLRVTLVAKSEPPKVDVAPPPPAGPPVPLQPWAVGVSAEQKAAARQHLDAGNALFLDHKYVEALGEYTLATAAWDHPAIRFNMVRCLIFLKRPLEASDHLKLALKYGDAPYDQTIYSEALAYQELLADEIGQVEINCDQPGVQLTMDGQPLQFACPGKEQHPVLPGQHQIVGTKDGFMPRTIKLVVLGGKHEHETVMLDPLSKVARTRTRWAAWKPWAVAGGGAAAVGVGVLFEFAASSNAASYDRYVHTRCPPEGCPADDPYLADHKSRARLDSGIGITSLTLGGAAIATGVVLLILNRPQTYYPEQIPAIMPAITNGGAGVLATGRF
jgi:hypothetical protein